MEELKTQQPSPEAGKGTGQPLKEPITSLDLRFLVKELRASLAGGVLRKVYQYGKSGTKQLLLEVFCPGKGEKLLYWDSSKAFITEKKEPVPVEPPNFCMFLRKHLLGRKIMDIRQYKFDRILEIMFQDHILILELIPPGNAILCDSSCNIIMPLEIQKWRDRVIRPREVYRHPRAGDNPVEMDFDGFYRLLDISEKETGAILAVNLGFGTLYSGELCHRAGLDSRAPGRKIPLGDAARLFNLIKAMLDMEAKPAIYEDMVSPFPLESRKDRPLRQAASLSSALDEFFSAQALEIAREEKREEIKREAEKTERIIDTQKEATGKWERISGDSNDTAGLIRKNCMLIEAVLNGINRARESGLSWEEIKQKIAGEQTPEASAIKEIREGDALVVLELDGKPVELDFRLGAEDNAARYFEDMKWAKRKLLGAEEALAEREKELNETEVQQPSQVAMKISNEEKTIEKPKRKRRKWFEKFHWFISSDGFLVIGGRDAKQNEMIINRHMDPGDLVFHTDMPGASFVVIRSEGKEISEYAKKEAAELAAAGSRAWSRGLGNMDIFCARPEQVSKTPPSGEYLPRGSFMITGQREWFRDIGMKLSIGIAIDRENREAQAISGPVMPVRTHSDYFVTIMPGYKKSLELAREIKNKIMIKARPEDKFIIDRIPLDDIQRLIPSGSGDVVEYGV